MNIFSTIFGFFVLIWNSILFNPAINIFVFFYKISDSNLGLAIVILTIVLRIVLWPLLKSQLESTKNMQKVQPRLTEIQKKYASDVVKLREEQMKIFKEEGVNPLGSCFSLIIQIPILYAVYEAIVVLSAHSASYVNKIMYFKFLNYPENYHYNLNFLGINVGKDAITVGIFSTAAIGYIILSVLVAYSQYLVTKVSLPEIKNETSEEVTKMELKNAKALKEKSKDGKEEKVIDPAAFGNMFSKQLLYFMPILLFIISLGILGPIPAALSVYWAVQSFVIYLQTVFLMKKNDIKVA